MKRRRISGNLKIAAILAVASVSMLIVTFAYAGFRLFNYWFEALYICTTCSDNILKTFLNLNHILFLVLGIWSLVSILKVTFFLLREYAFLRSIKSMREEQPNVYLVQNTNFAAWSGGVFRHSICINQDFWQSLSPSEQKALIAHETCHIDRRDALLFFLLGITESALFFPYINRIMNNVSKHMRLQSEYVADCKAIQATGRTALASLLHKALLFETDVNFSGPRIENQIHERVRLLTSGADYRPLSMKARGFAYTSFLLFGFFIFSLSLQTQLTAHCLVA